MDKNYPRSHQRDCRLILKRPKSHELDRRFSSSGLDWPLHCVPMIVKDNFLRRPRAADYERRTSWRAISRRDATQVARRGIAGDCAGEVEYGRMGVSPVETVSSTAGDIPRIRTHWIELRRDPVAEWYAIAASFDLWVLACDIGDSIRGPSSHLLLNGNADHVASPAARECFPKSARGYCRPDCPNDGRRSSRFSGRRWRRSEIP